MMGQTSNYKWSQPEFWEEVERQDWNETLSAIDAAVAAKADSASVNAALNELRATDATKADSSSVNSQISDMDSRMAALEESLGKKSALVTGTYRGNGASSRAISLGFQPQAVLVESESGLRSSSSSGPFGGLAMPARSSSYAGTTVISVNGTGFQVHESDGRAEVNTNSVTYYYLALR